MAEPRVLKLQSPAYGEPVFYKWPLANTKKHDEAAEIVDTIRLVCEDFPELKFAVEKVILKDYDSTDFESMSQLCQRYNKAIRNILSLWKGRAPPPRMFKPPNKELLRHIINLCYSHAIKEPEKLNLYEPFSPEVYGETSFDMVAKILEECQNSNDEVFIDLGSGVGQVVLQAAASNQFKECKGVEKAETPAMYAKAMEKEFKKWMGWFGKVYTDFILEKGDFLEDKWKDVINSCGIVFVNNFAFGPVVNHHLKQRFQQMKEGAQIISSREFCPLNFKFNKRNLSEVGAMMRVSELKPNCEEQSVSWTGNTVSYYLHVIDRTRLEKYFSILKKKKEGRELDEDEMSLYSESNLSADTTGTPKHEDTLEDNLDALYLGTTTRHQWQVLNNTIEQSRKEANSRDKKQTQGKYKKKKKEIKKLKETNGGELKEMKKSPGRPRTHPKRSGNIKLKNKILQKYGRHKSHGAQNKTEPKQTTHRKVLSKDVRKTRDCKMNVRSSSMSSLTSSSTIVVDTDDTQDEIEVEGKVVDVVRKACKKNSKITINKVKRVKESKKQVKKKDVDEQTNDKTQISANENQLDEEIDAFYDSMKEQCKEFIKRMNTREYAERLKVMIECERTKKKLLQQQVEEAESCVQELINSGLKSFSSRLEELDVAVKTPLELLSHSDQLTERRRQLENKVMTMEVEVFQLEEKCRTMRTSSDGSYRLELEMDDEEFLNDDEHNSRRNQLTNKLCGAILSAINHRRSLIDQQTSLTEQVTILEKIADPHHLLKDTAASEPPHDDEKLPKDNRPKPRPVAFVPPRILSYDKKSTLSPTVSTSTSHPQQQEAPTNTTIRRPRGRPRKRPKSEDQEQRQDRSLSTQSDSSQDSKMDTADERPAVNTTLQVTTIPPNFTSNTQLNQTRHDPRSVGGFSYDEYNIYQTTEEREPIVFPCTKTHLEYSENKQQQSSKEFLKASSRLLSSVHKDSWLPVKEINTDFKIVRKRKARERKTKSSNSSLSDEKNSGLNSHNLSLLTAANSIKQNRTDIPNLYTPSTLQDLIDKSIRGRENSSIISSMRSNDQPKNTTRLSVISVTEASPLQSPVFSSPAQFNPPSLNSSRLESSHVYSQYSTNNIPALTQPSVTSTPFSDTVLLPQSQHFNPNHLVPASPNNQLPSHPSPNPLLPQSSPGNHLLPLSSPVKSMALQSSLNNHLLPYSSPDKHLVSQPVSVSCTGKSQIQQILSVALPPNPTTSSSQYFPTTTDISHSNTEKKVVTTFIPTFPMSRQTVYPGHVATTAKLLSSVCSTTESVVNTSSPGKNIYDNVQFALPPCKEFLNGNKKTKQEISTTNKSCPEVSMKKPLEEAPVKDKGIATADLCTTQPVSYQHQTSILASLPQLRSIQQHQQPQLLTNLSSETVVVPSTLKKVNTRKKKTDPSTNITDVEKPKRRRRRKNIEESSVTSKTTQKQFITPSLQPPVLTQNHQVFLPSSIIQQQIGDSFNATYGHYSTIFNSSPVQNTTNPNQTTHTEIKITKTSNTIKTNQIPNLSALSNTSFLPVDISSTTSTAFSHKTSSVLSKTAPVKKTIDKIYSEEVISEKQHKHSANVGVYSTDFQITKSSPAIATVPSASIKTISQEDLTLLSVLQKAGGIPHMTKELLLLKKFPSLLQPHTPVNVNITAALPTSQSQRPNTSIQSQPVKTMNPSIKKTPGKYALNTLNQSTNKSLQPNHQTNSTEQKINQQSELPNVGSQSNYTKSHVSKTQQKIIQINKPLRTERPALPLPAAPQQQQQGFPLFLTHISPHTFRQPLPSPKKMKREKITQQILPVVLNAPTASVQQVPHLQQTVLLKTNTPSNTEMTVVSMPASHSALATHLKTTKTTVAPTPSVLKTRMQQKNLDTLALYQQHGSKIIRPTPNLTPSPKLISPQHGFVGQQQIVILPLSAASMAPISNMSVTNIASIPNMSVTNNVTMPNQLRYVTSTNFCAPVTSSS